MLLYKVMKVVAGLTSAGAALIGSMVLFVQVTGWLKTAYWRPYTIADAINDWGLPLPSTPLLGIQKIIDAMLAWSAVTGYIIITSAAALLLLWAMEGEQKLESERWRRAKAEKESLERTKRASSASVLQEFDDE